jgi:hypothetical protein
VAANDAAQVLPEWNFRTYTKIKQNTSIFSGIMLKNNNTPVE